MDSTRRSTKRQSRRSDLRRRSGQLDGFVLSVATVIFVMAGAAAAAPSIIVGTGTPESCTEAALQDALTAADSYGGGTIRFRCGPGPVLIVLTTQSEPQPGQLVTLSLPNNTTIDGEGIVGLASGLGEGSFIFVDPATTAVLKNLTLYIGGIAHGRLWNAGTLTLMGVSTFCSAGQPCISNTGNLTVKNSATSGVSNTIGLINNGTLNIKNSVFSDNYGTAVMNAGAASTATIESSTFERNNSDGFFGFGAAVVNSGTLIVKDTLFSDNQAAGGGAITNSGALTLKDSTFANNGASFVGGALYNTGTVRVDNSTFSGNRVSSNKHGGGAIFNAGALTVNNTDFLDNGTPGNAYGGAVYNAGALTVLSSIFSGNSGGFGGAIGNGGLVSYFTNDSPDSGPLTIRNSLITSNTAAEHGGGIYAFGTGVVEIDAFSQIVNNTPEDVFQAATATTSITAFGSGTPK